MDDLQFLNVSPDGNASLIIVLPDVGTSIITGLDVDIISQKCPLLAFSFEDRPFGLSQASIEASSRGLVVHFLQFLYLGDYNDQGGFGSEPCSLLRHAELLRMAEIFEVPELQTLAHVSILQDTEVSCSRPSPPDDLCSAISFIYAHLSGQRSLIESILHYCVSCFLYHSLGKNPAFRQLAYDLRPFSNDLIRTSYFRDFEDEGAMDIVNLPMREPNPFSNALNEQAALGDFLFDLFADNPAFAEEDAIAKMRRKRISEPTYTFVHRPRHGLPRVVPNAYSAGADTEGSETSASEAEGFTFVRRPKEDVFDVSEGDEPMTDVESDFEDVRSRTPIPRKDLWTSTGTIISLCDGNGANQESVKGGEEDNRSDSEWCVV
ncbi:hypothetical protein H2201_001774 [Coniosporium apollinis]|uniref:BTB domain-containing protein n=1 Tax=Coniosporium apollinis TaxID=61459 RepID=A0ABQ9P346_9PEZI|nr:hypothetical protein H2201_001774 [Coniosporium apollinis]